MDFVTTQNRQQITFSSLEDKITADNPVRFLEAFVEHLELEKLNFVVPELKNKNIAIPNGKKNTPKAR